MGACISLRRRGSAQVQVQSPPPEHQQSLSSLPENALGEIFLRLTPHPGFLREVSLSSHQLQDVVTNGPFLRRFHAHHGDAPPLVGFLRNESLRFLRTPAACEVARSRSATAAAAGAGPLAASDDDWLILCTRHGRVVLQSTDLRRLLVLDPMAAGRRQYIDAPAEYRRRHPSTAALVCDPEPAGHGGCRSFPFRIVFVFYNTVLRSSISIYSSATDMWISVAVDQTTPRPPAIDILRPSIQVGDVIYWFSIFNNIISFHVNTHQVREILLPVEIPRSDEYARLNTSVLAPKGSSLGFAYIGWRNLQLWVSNFINAVHVEWTPLTVVRLDNILPFPNPRALAMRRPKSPPVQLVGYDEDENMAYVWTNVGVFALQLDAMLTSKVPVDHRGWIQRVVYLYKSFYISEVGQLAES